MVINMKTIYKTVIRMLKKHFSRFISILFMGLKKEYEKENVDDILAYQYDFVCNGNDKQRNF